MRGVNSNTVFFQKDLSQYGISEGTPVESILELLLKKINDLEKQEVTISANQSLSVVKAIEQIASASSSKGGSQQVTVNFGAADQFIGKVSYKKARGENGSIILNIVDNGLYSMPSEYRIHSESYRIRDLNYGEIRRGNSFASSVVINIEPKYENPYLSGSFKVNMNGIDVDFEFDVAIGSLGVSGVLPFEYKHSEVNHDSIVSSIASQVSSLKNTVDILRETKISGFKSVSDAEGIANVLSHLASAADNLKKNISEVDTVVFFKKEMNIDAFVSDVESRLEKIYSSLEIISKDLNTSFSAVNQISSGFVQGSFSQEGGESVPGAFNGGTITITRTGGCSTGRCP